MSKREQKKTSKAENEVEAADKPERVNAKEVTKAKAKKNDENTVEQRIADVLSKMALMGITGAAQSEEDMAADQKLAEEDRERIIAASLSAEGDKSGELSSFQLPPWVGDDKNVTPEMLAWLNRVRAYVNPRAKYIRNIVRGKYDLQLLRTSSGNRIVMNSYIQRGLKPGQKLSTLPQEEMDKKADSIRPMLMKTFDSITDKIVAQAIVEEKLTAEQVTLASRLDVLPRLVTIRNFKPEGIISSFLEYGLVRTYLQTSKLEKEADAAITMAVSGEKIWQQFLSKVPGIAGPTAGIIISEINPYACKYPSSIWKLIGIDVAPDGMGRSKRKEHLISRPYIDKDGNTVSKASTTYNPELKTKVVGVIAANMIKVCRWRLAKCEEEWQSMVNCRRRIYSEEDVQARKMAGKEPKFLVGAKIVMEVPSIYAEAYYNAKDRYEKHAIYGIHNDKKYHAGKGGEKYVDSTGKCYGYISPKRRHNQAVRIMLKRFLIDLYKTWRAIEGLTVHPEYSEAKLGMKHGEGQPPKLPPAWQSEEVARPQVDFIPPEQKLLDNDEEGLSAVAAG